MGPKRQINSFVSSSSDPVAIPSYGGICDNNGYTCIFRDTHVSFSKYLNCSRCCKNNCIVYIRLKGTNNRITISEKLL